MARVRTLDGAVEYYKTKDPQTAITKFFLRRMVITDQIWHVMSGKKYLVDLDQIEAYLSGELKKEANNDV